MAVDTQKGKDWSAQYTSTDTLDNGKACTIPNERHVTVVLKERKQAQVCRGEKSEVEKYVFVSQRGGGKLQAHSGRSDYACLMDAHGL